METPLTICLLAIFIARGASLQCPTCNTTGQACQGPAKECSPGYDKCGIIQTQNSFEPKHTIEKKCIQSKECDKGITVIYMGKKGSIMKNVTCCMGEECLKKPPPLPGRNTSTSERKICPACYSEENACKEETIVCTGADEIYCAEVFLQQISDAAGGKNTTITMKGCANKAFCDNNVRASTTDATTSVPPNQCELATSGAASTIPGSSGLFLSAHAGLLFVAVFL